MTHGGLGPAGFLPSLAPWEGQGKDAAFSLHPSHRPSPCLHSDLRCWSFLSRLRTVSCFGPCCSQFLMSLISFPSTAAQSKELNTIDPCSISPDLCCITGDQAMAPCQLCLAFPAPKLSPASFWFHGAQHDLASRFLSVGICVCMM